MGACRTCLIFSIRLIQLVLAFAIIAFGAWSIHIINDIRENGDELLGKAALETDIDTLINIDKIREFFDSLLQTPKRVYFAITAGAWTVCAIIGMEAYRKFARSAKRAVMVVLELFTCLMMVAALACITTLTVSLIPMCLVVDLIPPLVLIVRVCPMSKAWTATLALGSLLFMISLIVACCSKTKEKQSTSPTPIPIEYHMDPKTSVTYQNTYEQQPQVYYGQGQPRPYHGQQYGYFPAEARTASPQYTTLMSSPGVGQTPGQTSPLYSYPGQPTQSPV
ncbi:hypothetical protein K458DRAFT_391762 [Lentithecium fluviatile CBS 122367]|uniref:Uncharacterized protein n=1 Tax=Lentithecium fluviatile CBS 122367 TaxID=1168545 RepID=A0A6G1IV99_9PLEO|nr:hypothetical protein K458DRAFT_391762 [Lentithecium fluviatile CBS 122367]